jgi:predicted nuclease of predicted toxin-antitoxin system
MTKLLIDECLSSALALIARERGHHEASHVVWIGKAGWKDWELKETILEGDWVLVTKNSADFRGPVAAPGSKGQYANVPLHCGLICLNGPVGMDLALQGELFLEALNQLELDEDLTNQVLEVTCSDDQATVEVIRYHMPRE